MVGRKQREEKESAKNRGFEGVVGVVFSGDNNSGALSKFVSDGWKVSLR